MDAVIILGLTAGVITSISFVPQILKAYQTKKLEDVSYTMYLILTIGLILWLMYGILIEEMPVIAANAFGVGCCLFTIGLKYLYSRKTDDL